MPDLLDVVKVTLGGVRPGEMLPNALELMVEQAGAQGGAAFILDLRTGRFELGCEAVGIDTSMYDPVWVGSQLSFVLAPEEPVATDHPQNPIVPVATENGILQRTDDDPWYWSSLGVGEGQGALLIPVLRADTCLGAVLLVRDEPFEDREQQALFTSTQAFAAIYDLRTQYQLLGEMRAPLDLRQPRQEFFESVVRLLTSSSGMEFIAIRRLEPDGALTMLTAAGLDVERSNIDVGSELAAPFERAIRGREAVNVDSVALEGLGNSVAGFAPEVRSFVVAPIVLGESREVPTSTTASAGDRGHDDEPDVGGEGAGRVFGTLSVGCRVEYQYSPIERLGFMSLANSIGLAIENYWNVSRIGLLREKQVEAGAALQAQEMAQGFRHEIRKKLDNINGIFATSLGPDRIEEMVHRQTMAIADVLDEWRSHAKGVEYRWEWVGLADLWAQAVEHAEFQLGQANVEVRDMQIPRGIEVFCSPPHFVRFVLDGLILNSVDAFRDRGSRSHRELGLSYIGDAGTVHVLRYFDTAGGIRADRVKGLQRRRADWNELPAGEVIFEAGFSTKTSDTSGVGGGYGLYLARSTLTQHAGEMALVEAGEPGAVFDLRLAQHHVRRRAKHR